jgi:hypothetical protein
MSRRTRYHRESSRHGLPTAGHVITGYALHARAARWRAAREGRHNPACGPTQSLITHLTEHTPQREPRPSAFIARSSIANSRR